LDSLQLVREPPQEEPDQYTLKEGNVLKAESVLRQLAPPDEWCAAAHPA
jgi:hypothetical protein